MKEIELVLKIASVGGRKLMKAMNLGGVKFKGGEEEVMGVAVMQRGKLGNV